MSQDVSHPAAGLRKPAFPPLGDEIALGIKKGEMELKLGKFITTETPVEDLRSQIMQFSFPGPTAAGINLMELLDKRASRLAYVTEAVAGQTEKVMQPHAILATRTVWHCIQRYP